MLVNGENRPRPLTMTPDDELVREPLYPPGRLPRPPQSGGRTALLVALAALLILTIAGTTALVVRDIRLSQQAGKISIAPTATIPSGTATPDHRDPSSNGWTPVSGGTFADVQFTQQSGQRGYLCGTDTGASKRLVGVTTDGGNTWQVGPSSAGYDYCSLQVSATNPLDVLLLSSSRCSECEADDIHYSTDGGKTWKAAPSAAGAVWAGQYLFIWTNSSQQGALKVSANGGAFSTIAPNTVLPGASGVFIQQMVAGGTTVYATLAYNGCSSSQGCTAVVASSDGGKTWARISNTFNMHVVWVAGTTLYGEIFPQYGAVQTSTDNGATWKPLALPRQPDGTTAATEIPGTLLPAADGTIFTLDSRAGNIAYLRGGSWTEIPFSSHGVDGPLGSVTFGPDGHPQRVWVFSTAVIDGAPFSAPMLYWHAL
jgi:photosystem II stability/assembly factor-like uncharacterized protein